MRAPASRGASHADVRLPLSAPLGRVEHAVQDLTVRHGFLYENAEAYRNIPEARIVGFLCSPFEIHAGRVEAETEAMKALLQRLIDLGLPFRTVGGERLFDLAEVANFIKYAFYAFGEPTWMERSVGTMRRVLEGGSRSGERVAVTVRRRFLASAIPPNAAARIHMPKPLNADPATHRAQWLSLDGAVGEPVDEGCRYAVKARRTGALEVEIAVRHEFVPADVAAVDLDAHLALGAREGLVQLTPRIRAMAEDLGLLGLSRAACLRRIWDLLFDELSFGFIQYDRLRADDPLGWCLDNRRVDCRTGSALLIALCRAVGIPARLVTGYTLNPVLPTTHAWAEVWIDGGWRAFDTYAVDLAGGDRDSPWRDYYFGRIDPRFVAEVLPRAFCGFGSLRLSPRRQLSMAITDKGAATWFHDVTDGVAFHCESVAVELL